MNPQLYDKIKSQIPSSLRMKLDHIKRYLDEGKASAMVGAGFSKNARMPEAAEMKDWNALGRDFYERLYGKPEEWSLMFQNPIGLASQVEASFGRHELDDLIQQSLPDDIIVPSQLHVDLLNLGWHDIFTTNYDTLLERACLDADHPYTVVYNKDTLLYSVSPRIVKLHGSFPNIRPYIITEEDFRTYPKQYPEFVNTVRQSLIENLFCLIGFSGDDPNFKSWLEWLRDVMGQRISPVYYITYDDNLHDARRNLLARQKIEVLNLHDLPEAENIQEAFDFFFSYLRKENNTKWSGSLSKRTRKIESEKQVKEMIKELASIRKTYPNWLLLTKDHYCEFNDVQSDMPYWQKVTDIDGLKQTDLIAFLWELKWRLEVSLTPVGVEWYISVLEFLDFNSSEYEVYIIDLKLTLLIYYRIVGKETEYDALTKELEKRKAEMNTTQLRRYFYDRCLMASSKMQYDLLGNMLTEWQVFETDFVGALWKSAMLMENGQRGEALNLLNRALVQLRRTLLSNPQESYFYRGCQIALERSLYIYRGGGGKNRKYQSCDYVEEMRFFKEKFTERKKKKQITKTHGFNVDDVKTTWHLGSSGYVEDYLYAYRYYALCEQVGIPMGTVDFTMNTADHETYLPRYLMYNHYFPIGVMARSCNEKMIGNVLNRCTMSTISRELANDYFDFFFAYANQLEKADNHFARTHIFQSCLPLLVRLCSKASPDRVKKMALYILEVHNHVAPNEETQEYEYVKTIYNSLSKSDMQEVLAKIFEQPISLSVSREDDYYIPLGWAEGVSFSSIAIDVVLNGLQDPDEKVQEVAFLRSYQILRGIISDAERERLCKAIIDWRNSTNQMQHVAFSFIDVPPIEGEKYTPQGLLQENINALLAVSVDDIRSSQSYDHIADLYQRINYAHDSLGEIDATTVIKHFTQMVVSNEELLRKDDDSFMGGFRNNVTNVVEGFMDFILSIDVAPIPVDVLQSLTDAVQILSSLSYPHFTLLLILRRYDSRLNESALKKQMQDAVTSSATIIQAMDVARAIEVINKRGGSCQEVIHRIVSFCEYSTDRAVSHWLYALNYLFVKHTVKPTSKSKFEHLLSAIFANDNYKDGDAERLTDIRHGASRLAGAMAREWGDSEATDSWKNLSADDSGEFNDVSYVFERGR